MSWFGFNLSLSTFQTLLWTLIGIWRYNEGSWVYCIVLLCTLLEFMLDWCFSILQNYLCSACLTRVGVPTGCGSCPTMMPCHCNYQPDIPWVVDLSNLGSEMDSHYVASSYKSFRLVDFSCQCTISVVFLVKFTRVCTVACILQPWILLRLHPLALVNVYTLAKL